MFKQFSTALFFLLLTAAPAMAAGFSMIEKFAVSERSGASEVTMRVYGDGRASTPRGHVALTPPQVSRLSELASAAMTIQADDNCRPTGYGLTKFGFRIYTQPNVFTVTYYANCRLSPGREALRYELEQLESFLNQQR